MPVTSLQEEYGERPAAKDVPPTAVFPRHGMLGNSRIGAASRKATIKPFANLGSRGAWRFLSEKNGARSRRGQFAGLNRDEAVSNFVRILETSRASGGPEGTRTSGDSKRPPWHGQ